MAGARSDPRHERLLEEVEVLEGASRAQCDAVQRILGHVTGHARDLGEQLVDVAQQRAAAGHDHALVDDVARQLRRRLLEHLAHRGHDLLERLVSEMVRGRPAMRSRPRTSIWSSRSRGSAAPIWILTSSEVRSPTMRLYFLRM